MKRFLVPFIAICGLHFASQACTPLNVPTLVSQNISGNFLNLNWSSNTIYNCTYYIQVEIVCNTGNFTGTGPFYQSATINKTSTPFAYPVQSINISTLCPGTVYKFRARESYTGFPAFSAWTATFTFTTPGVFVQPTVTVTGNPLQICIPQTSQLNATIANSCGGSTPTYTWSPAASLNNATIANPVASPTTTTTYTCVVTGGPLGCWTTQSTVTIQTTVPPVAGTASVSPNPICSGTPVTLTLTGYTGTIQWQSGPTASGPWTNIPGGTTTPFVTAPLTSNTCFQAVVSGCGTVTSNVVCVTVNPAPVANAGPNTQVCMGFSTTLNANGGGTYSWSPSSSLSNSTVANPVATPTSTTTYTVTVTLNGCTATSTVTVNVNPVQTLSMSVTNPQCFNGCNGSITVTPSGGNPPYTYSWNPSGQTAPTATGLCAGTYTVTVTSTNGCTATATATVSIPSALAVSIPTSSNVTCFNACNGSANSSVSGGTPPYSYSWLPSGGNGPNATGLCAGTYTLTVTDAGSCTMTATVTITQPTQLTLNTAGFPALCNGACNGQAVVIPSGGTNPYAYLWLPGNGTNASANGLCAGTYTVTVTDGNGCTATDTAIVTQPSVITLTTSSNPSICGQPNGSANVNATGGVGNYTYLWTPSSATSATATGLMANTYTVVVTDANNCTASATVTVGNTAGPSVSITGSTNATCFGYCDGTATAAGSGGTPPYNYSWAPSGGNAATATGLCANTTYTVTITDVNNCTASATVSITEPPQLVLTPGPGSTICIGQSVTLTATGSGGTPTYTYTWTPSGPTVNPTSTTTYTVTITDANGCTAAAQTITVTVNPPLQVTASNPPAICLGSSANIAALGSGGNGGPYTYNWMPGNLPGSSVTVSPTSTTTYTVTLTDNCGTPPATATVTVTVNPPPVVTFAGTDTTGCVPLTVTFSNNTTGSVSCLWNFGDNQTSTSCGNPVTHTYTTPGIYTVTLTVTDANGCTATSTHVNMVNVYGMPTACFTYGPQPTSILNATIDFTDCSSGASSWQWNFGDVLNSTSTQQNPTFTYTDTGSFQVQLLVCNSNGCCDSVIQTVVIGPDFTLFVPNAFTPDGDGINEDFFPKGTGIKEDTYTLWIFDRWGNLIFTTQNWNKHWDGKVQGKSALVQEDVYVWKIQINDIWDKKHVYVGHVSVIR